MIPLVEPELRRWAMAVVALESKSVTMDDLLLWTGLDRDQLIERLEAARRRIAERERE